MRARGQKTGEGLLREAQAGAASAVCERSNLGNLRNHQVFPWSFVIATSGWVESTTGAVVGRRHPIYTHSVSSRRSANRTCGFAASGSLRAHAFAHGGSRVGADGRTRRNNVLGARRAGGESPCRPSRASGATTGGAGHGPERRHIADCRRFRPGATASSSIHARLPPSLSHVVPCGAPRLSGVARRSASIACRSLRPAPLPDQGSFPPPALPGLIGTTTLSATPGAGSAPHSATVDRLRLPAAPRGFPCCTQPLFRTCRRHYPGGTVGCVRRSLPQRRRPSPNLRRVGFRIALFEACSAFTARWPVRSLSPLRTLFFRSFDRFVTSTAVPIATGWNDFCRVGFAPTQVVHLCTAH